MELYDYQNDLVDRARQAYVDGYKAPCIVIDALFILIQGVVT
ncbi:hypothetical protein EB19_00568 [Enterococcus faecium]|nr:hypothetical protein EB19_00568 [Enterococcus faecium]